MSDLSADSPWGALKRDWTAQVADYALAGGWCLGRKVLIVGDAVGGVYAFDGASGAPLWSEHNVHDGGLLALAIHPDGTSFATAGQDGRVVIWGVADGRQQQSVEVGTGWVEHIAWSQDGRWLAASCSRQVSVFTVEGCEVWRSGEHPSTVSAMAWTPKRELATACYGRVSFFNGTNGKRRHKFEWQGSLVSMVLSPDGDVVACGSQDNTVHFWRRSTGRDSRMSGYSAKPSALAFNGRGTFLATGGSETITVWDFRRGPEGTEPRTSRLHGQPVTTLAFARLGKRLASASRDGSVVVWSMKKDGNGEPVGAAFLEDVGSALYWRPDGRALATLDASGVVAVWRTS